MTRENSLEKEICHRGPISQFAHDGFARLFRFVENDRIPSVAFPPAVGFRAKPKRLGMFRREIAQQPKLDPVLHPRRWQRLAAANAQAKIRPAMARPIAASDDFL